MSYAETGHILNLDRTPIQYRVSPPYRQWVKRAEHPVFTLIAV
jgi:hypothetical protein